jgi:hypothetical protein
MHFETSTSNSVAIAFFARETHASSKTSILCNQQVQIYIKHMKPLYSVYNENRQKIVPISRDTW